MLIGIYSNREKDRDFSVTQRVLNILNEKRIRYFIDDDYENNDGGAIQEIPHVVIVIGGDGTMLAATRKYAELGCMFMGINMGRVGFLLEVDAHSAELAISRILQGDYKVQERMMLCARSFDAKGNQVACTLALNEVILTHYNGSKLVNIEISVDEDRVANLYCNGVIISTPTGSTGYSMSAGGSIIHPVLDIMQITPICSHSISVKSTIISAKANVKLAQMRTDCEVDLVADGIPVNRVQSDGHVEVSAADFKAKFISFDINNFFATLRNKLTEWNLQ